MLVQIVPYTFKSSLLTFSYLELLGSGGGLQKQPVKYDKQFIKLQIASNTEGLGFPPEGKGMRNPIICLLFLIQTGDHHHQHLILI